MLWSTFGKGGYLTGIARSMNGEVTGSWVQAPAPLITTAVCEALCGSIPIITTAMNDPSSWCPVKTVAGTPDFRTVWRSRLF